MEPAGVHGDGRQEPLGNLGRELTAQGRESVQYKHPGRLSRGVFEDRCTEVILTDVVVDDDPRTRKSPDQLGHVSELVPGREVEDDRDLAIGELGGLDDGAEPLEELLVGVEKIIARGHRARVDHADVLPHLTQQPGHADFRAQGVAVGPDVRCDQEAVVGFNHVFER